MSDDLVKRANFALDDMQGRVDATKLQVFQECIDRIEELDKACKEWAEVSQRNYQRAKAAEVKLAKVMVALNYFLLRDPDKPTSWEYSRNRAEELARTTLAELLKERSDEKGQD